MSGGRRRRRAGAAVEFAITLPFVLFIFMAAVEYGSIYTQQAWVQNSVRDATRYAITLDEDPTDVEDAVETRVQTMLTGFGYNCTALCKVKATYNVDALDETYDVLVVVANVVYEPLSGLVPVPDYLHGEQTMLMLTVARDTGDTADTGS